MKRKLLKLLSVAIGILFTLTSLAQYTTIHYIPPSPWQYNNNANQLEITTMSTTPVPVTIELSDGTVISNSLTTVYGTPLSYTFTPVGVAPNLLNQVLSGRGLIVKALSPVGVQVRNIASDAVTCSGACYGGNADCSQKGNSAFTSLGDQGLGTSFRIGYYANVTGTNWNCNNESQTPIYAFMAIYDATNLYLNGKLITTLNAGQSYLFQSSIGSEVTSSLPIVGTSGMRIDNTSGCGDGVCGQMIPEDYLGEDYIIVRSTGNAGYEQSTIVATAPNTTVTVSITGGATKTYTLANAGSYVTIPNGDGSTAYSTCYVTANSSVAVYSGSASGCEIDMIVQPPITTCAGSFDVQTTKFVSNANTGSSALPYFGYILVESDTAVVYFNGVNLESLTSKRTAVANSGFYIIQFTNTQLGNPSFLNFLVNARVNVAMVESGGGYSMSSFISSISNSMPPPAATSSCLPSVFSAQGGFDSYQWYLNNVAIKGATSQTFTPSSTGIYSVAGNSLTCGSTTISPTVTVNAKPTVSVSSTACSGTSVSLTGSNPATANWIVGTGNPSGATLGNTTNGAATVIFGSTAVGTYNFIYNAGCSDTAAIVVKATSTSTTRASICNGASYLFNGTSYTTSGTYTVHLTNAAGCDSAATLILTVKSLSSSTTNANICTGSSYTFNGTAYNTSGTYTIHLTNSAGCDSAATLVLTVNSPSTSTTNASICTGSSYSFNGVNYTTAGTRTIHLTNAVGCDSAATLVLTVNSPSSSTTTASICSGSSYRFNGTDYTSSGTYTSHLTNSVGCDSAATLVLTVKSLSTSTTSATIPLGNTYTFNGTSYSSAGTYTVHLTNSAGCDSAATLVLTVYSYSNTTASICAGGSYTFNGTAYSTSGTYTAHLTSSKGTDSVATLILTVKPTSTSTTNASICNGNTYTFNGTGYTNAGTYVAHLTNSVGCDSAATLILTVKSLSTSTTTAAICNGGSYTFNGTTYTTPGSYTVHLTNSVGCDSAATLVLTIKSLSTSTTTASICSNSSYTFNGTAYSTSGTYVAHLTNSVGCDSAATLVLTVKSTSTSTTNISICSGGSYIFNGTTYTTAGTYTVHFTNSVGCDSAATLVLKVNANPTVAAITGTSSFCAGSTTALSDATSGGVWSSGSTSIASINTSGVVTGVSAGAVAITYTVTNSNGCSSLVNANLVVNALPAVSPITGTSEVCVGSTTALSDITFGGTWSSTGTNIITINSNGVVSGVAAGNSTVSYTLASASGCSTTVSTTIFVNVPTTSTTNATICSGSSYTFNGNNYTTAGSYLVHLINANGCDSAATLVLTVKPLSTSTTNASICAGGSYTFNGTTYTTAGTYVAHLTNSVGCDSAATLVLTVKSLSTSTTNTSICNGGSYTFNGTAYTTAGTYIAHLTNSVGCDSAATLILTVKSLSTSTTTASICNGGSYTFNGTAYTTAGTYVAHLTNSVGCDSAATLVLTVKSLSTSTTNASICNGGSYTFNGTTYTTAGTYVAHLTNSVGCDSAATLVLTVKSLSTSTTTAAICNGGSYTFNGSTYTNAGTYVAHLTNSVGCDSAATLVLTVKSLSTSTTNASICNGGSYTFNGSTYTNAGTYVAHLTNSVGCDSAATLILTVKSLSTSTTNASICNGGSYTFNGTTYTNAGTYVAHLTNSVGCDSAATLALTVKSLSTSSTNITACSSYVWNGTTYTISGTYTYHTLNAVGCDSTATLVLTINQPTISSTSITACSSYLWNGITYTISGTYTYHTLNAVGCDSTATLNLTINEPSTSSTSITACSSYVWNGVTYTTSGSYTYHTLNSVGCDSTATLNLTINQPSTSTTAISICNGGSYTFNGTSYTTAGTYVANFTNSAGCDSTATLVLTVNNPSSSTTTATICAGNSYLFNGTSQTTTGTYVAHLTNSVGCDSAATLILTVNPLPSFATINGKDSLCGGSVDSFSASIAGGVWGVSTLSIATINAKGNVSAIASGKDTISYTLTNTCGTATATKVIYIGTTIPSVQLIAGTSTACPGFTSTLIDATLGGYWTSADTSIATVDSTSGIVTGVATGTANIIYTAVSAYGCTNSTSVPFTVNCGSVTSAGDGGLESKSMGEAVATRVYNRALANTINTVDYSTLPTVKYAKKQFGIMGIGTAGSQALTDLMPSANAIGTGYDSYDMSEGVADLSGITNASIAKAYDYVANNSTKSATLITRTYGLVYQHTKPICDRLKEATLLDVRTITVKGMDFIQYKLLQNTGQVEYAISFSAGIQNNVDSFRIQSVWLTKNFINQDTMYNFQIWAVDPMMASNMLNNVLNKLGNLLPLSQINKQAVPSTYISNIARSQNKLILNINNNTSATSASLNLSVTNNETTTSLTPQTVPVTLLPNATTQVVVDLQDNFESDVNLYVDNNQTDLAYINDGNWNYSLNNASVKPNAFTVSNDGIMPSDSSEFRLFRTVNINVNVPDYVSVYKMMKAGGLSKDLTGYTNLLFTASASGAGTLKITIQKNSISNWNNQYSYTIPISSNTTGYAVRLRDFTSAGSTDTLTANDVVTVTFSFIGDGSGNINATIFNARFTQKDYVYIDSLTDKTVSAYPNPTNGHFNCVFKSNVDTKLTLKIVQLGTGRVVYTQNINAVTGQNTVPISTTSSFISDGYYILELENAGGNYIPYKMLFKR